MKILMSALLVLIGSVASGSTMTVDLFNQTKVLRFIGSVKYGYPRELYSTFGTLIGDMDTKVVKVGEREYSYDIFKALLLEGGVGQHDLKLSMGWAHWNEPPEPAYFSTKGTFLYGTNDNKNNVLEKYQKALGAEFTMSYIANLDLGIFKNLNNNEWFTSIGIGIGY